MLRLKQLISKFFGFSKTEANGAVVLFALICLCIVSPYIYRGLFGIRYESFEEDQQILDSLVAQLNFEVKPRPEIEIILKPFDPNNTSVEELKSLGIPDFLSRRIESYKNAGGEFRVKNDLAKIYDFPDSLFRVLRPYISLPDELKQKAVRVSDAQPAKKPNPKATYVKRESRYSERPLLVDINLADTLEFQKLYGIGSGYSRRLVSFREALGGYHSVDQIKDVYGMSDSLYYQIKSFLTVSDTVNLKVIAINIATYQQLISHPYINSELTKEILAAKSKYGKFKRLEDLKRLTLLDSVGIARLGPYLKF